MLAAGLCWPTGAARGPRHCGGHARCAWQAAPTEPAPRPKLARPAGNPCRLPAHDPAEQAHSSAPGDGTRPLLLLASGSGAQQHGIAEPFTVAELQRAAATVATEGAKAAARSQFFVRRLAGAQGLPAGVAARATAGSTAAAGDAAALPQTAPAPPPVEAGDDAAGGRYNLSGAAGGSSGDEADDGPAGSAAHADACSPPLGAAAAAPEASADRAVSGLPAAGCWLELHVLGPRAQWKTPALAAALLLDGQPGWLRAGCVFGALPLLVGRGARGGRSRPLREAGCARLLTPAGQHHASPAAPSSECGVR